MCYTDFTKDFTKEFGFGSEVRLVYKKSMGSDHSSKLVNLRVCLRGRVYLLSFSNTSTVTQTPHTDELRQYLNL